MIPEPWHSCLCFISSLVFILGICYIFYPAYTILEDSLGCSETVLVGGVDGYEGVANSSFVQE